MRVSVWQKDLLNILKEAKQFIDSKPSLPVLENIHLETVDARLKVFATNLDSSYIGYVGAKVDQPGAFTLPAKSFTEYVATLPPEQVSLDLDAVEQKVMVRCGATKTRLKGMVASEYPPAPVMEKVDVTISALAFKAALNKVLFCAAREESRPILTGVNFVFEGTYLTLATANGYRLAVAKLEIPIPMKKSIVVPAEILNKLLKIIKEDADLQMDIGYRGIIFKYGWIEIASQLLEGKFPDFTAIIPKTYTTQMVMYRDDLKSAAKRAEIFSRDSNFSTRFSLTIPEAYDTPSELIIKGVSAERGDAEIFLDCFATGESYEVAMNIRYVQDIVNALDSEQIVMQSHGGTHPQVIYPRDDDSVLYVVMSMGLNR